MATRPGAAASPAVQSPRSEPIAVPVDSRQAARDDQERPHDGATMCRYPSKKCWNPRALKRNGEKHNLCDFHRQKANKNQRRLELKRKTKAQTDVSKPQTAATPAPANKRARHQQAQVKKPRQRARRAPLSAHLAMLEEARSKRLVAAATSAPSPALTSRFLQDLVLLDGVYDRSSFVEALKDASTPAVSTVSTASTAALATSTTQQQHLTSSADDTLDRLLLEGADDVVAICKNLDASPAALAASLPEGKTSPVDVGESWDAFEMSECWLAPAGLPALSFDASAFMVDDDVFITDV
ncbi:hypothetical protein BBJ28_00007369 [Nothophytophthora sp. Chile5]|nr:hypothetical protein BBJ28_00007369 [Nothophytophthora sp. Chile5]